MENTSPAPYERDIELELTIRGFGNSGDGIARNPGGGVVSIPGSIPGETVKAKALARRRGIIHARVLEVLDPSPNRVAPPCSEIANGCGACQWQHIDLAAQRSYKYDQIADALGVARVEDPTHVSLLRPMIELPPTGFRTTLHAAVSNGRAGLRRYRSHRVVPVEECLVAHPLLNDLIQNGKYPGATDVLLRCGERTGERLAMPDPLDIRMVVPSDVRTDHIHEEAAGMKWRISADSFFQARPDGVDALGDAVRDAADEMGEPGHALDLYSGVGVFAGVLALRGWSVTAVEGDEGAVRDAVVNLRGLEAKAIRADVNEWSPPKSDLVVADPSRAGLGSKGVGVVVASKPRRVVLISCDANSLNHDAHLLGKAGYKLSYATPIDLFPHTYHVEVVSVFDRA